tara:strand:+ start:2308 stop:2517 length:210 start_codon:yes stop_codon:yes gene_type:complete
MDDVDRDGDPILKGGGVMPEAVVRYSLSSGIKMCVIKQDKLNELIAIINGQDKELKKLRENLERIGADG